MGDIDDSPLLPTLPDSSGPPSPGSARFEGLDRGATLGRFVVLEPIGAGGMGVVLAAYDPQLDRRVAIKLLRSDVWRDAADEGKRRLQREAQAMARLNHPNVVTVHEVGSLGNDVFIVMEYVAGTHLGAWLRAAERSPEAIIAMFAAASQGLLAAHRAGVIHRDFKPENVLVDEDNRVRVTDFGLAGGFVTSNLDGAAPATIDGAGTSRYMAPEQHAGSRADARADQFALCVALFEAVHGRYPFAADHGAAAVSAKRDGPVATSSRPRGLSKRRDAAIRRGLAAEPEDRWPSIAELVAQLEPGTRRTRRALFGAALGCGALVAAFALWPDGDAREASCDGGPALVADLWDPADRTRVRAAFQSSKVAFADESFERIDARLSAATGSWADLHRDVCRATRVRGEQSEALMDHRIACLERARLGVAELVAELGRRPDEGLVTRAVQATEDATRFDHCPGTTTLVTVPPAPPHLRGRVLELEREADAIRTLGRLARFSDARTRGQKLLAAVRTLGHAPLLADVLSVVSTIERQGGGERPVARALALESIDVAAAVGRDDLVAFGTAELLFQLAAPDGESRDAELVSRLAGATRRRAGGAPVEWARLRTAQGMAYEAAGNFAKAVERHREAVALLDGKDNPLVLAQALNALANAEEGLAAYAEARKHYEQALKLFEASLGPSHPSVAGTLNNLGLIAHRSADYAAADAFYDRAIAIKTRVFGANHLSVARTLNAVGMLRAEQGRFLEAKVLYERVIGIRETALGPRDQSLASTLGSLSTVEVSLGHLDVARALAQRGLDILSEVYGPAHGRVGVALVELGDVLLAAKDLPAARRAYQRATSVLSAAKGAEHPDHAMALAGLVEVDLAEKRFEPALVGCQKIAGIHERSLGATTPHLTSDFTNCAQALRGLGRDAEAINQLTRAVEIAKQNDLHQNVAVQARFELAKLLWKSAGERDRARQLVRDALAVGKGHPGIDVSGLQDWLDRHVN